MESLNGAEIPPDLVALEQDDQAKAFFEGLGRTDQYAVILRLIKARTPESRAARLQKMIILLAAGQKVN